MNEIQPPDLTTLLPVEVWSHIFKFCDDESVRLVCTLWYAHTESWYNQYTVDLTKEHTCKVFGWGPLRLPEKTAKESHYVHSCKVAEAISSNYIYIPHRSSTSSISQAADILLNQKEENASDCLIS